MKTRDEDRITAIAAISTLVATAVLAFLVVLASTASSTATTLYRGFEAIGSSPGLVGNYLVADGTALILGTVALLVLVGGMIVTSRVPSASRQGTVENMSEWGGTSSSRRDKAA